MEPFHAEWFRQYKYDMTDDNYSIRFEMKNSIRTAIKVTNNTNKKKPAYINANQWHLIISLKPKQL